MLLMAVTSSVIPLLWMMVRAEPISKDDLLYSLVLWKLLGLYAIVRFSVTTDRQVRRCLWLSVAAACIVAALAILQSLGKFGVTGFLAHYYSTTTTDKQARCRAPGEAPRWGCRRQPPIS